MATSFGHNGRHQVISHKLTKAGTYNAKCQFIWDPIYSHINIYLLTAAIFLTALKCAIYSMMCRGSVVEVVSTVKIYGIVTLVKTVWGLNL